MTVPPAMAGDCIAFAGGRIYASSSGSSGFLVTPGRDDPQIPRGRMFAFSPYSNKEHTVWEAPLIAAPRRVLISDGCFRKAAVRNLVRAGVPPMRPTFGADVLACPRCGGRLCLVALIDQTAVIQRIRSGGGSRRIRSDPTPAVRQKYRASRSQTRVPGARSPAKSGIAMPPYSDPCGPRPACTPA